MTRYVNLWGVRDTPCFDNRAFSDSLKLAYLFNAHNVGGSNRNTENHNFKNEINWNRACSIGTTSKLIDSHGP